MSRYPSLLFAGILLAQAPVLANPVNITQYPLITEVQATDTGWALEIDYSVVLMANRDSEPCPSMGSEPCTLRTLVVSHARSSVPWATYPTQVIADASTLIMRPGSVGTSAGSPEPFAIDPVLDTVRVSIGEGGTSWQVVIRNLLPTQSLATRCYNWCVFATPTYEWMKDNSPTMGLRNDTTNVFGVIEGRVLDSDSVPVAGQYVYWATGAMITPRCFGVRTDSAGFYRIRISTQADLALRLVDSLGNKLSPDSIGGLRIEPDSAQVVNIVLSGLSGATWRKAPRPASEGVRVFAVRGQSADNTVRLGFTSNLAPGGTYRVQVFALGGRIVAEQELTNHGPGTYMLSLPSRHLSRRTAALVCRVAVGGNRYEQTVVVK
jgi:hypothetical protein